MSTSQPDSTASQPARKEKVEKTLFDTDFFADSNIEEIEALYGDAAPAYYLRIALRILREGGPIRFSAAVAILQKTELDERAESFLGTCADIGLFYRDGELISSSRADREISKLGGKRDAWRKRQRRSRDSDETPSGLQADSIENPPSVTRDTPVSHATVTRDSEKEEEQEGEEDQEQEPSKKKRITGKRPKKEPPYRAYADSDFAFPPKWGREATEALGRWVAYKSLAGHPSLLTSYQGQVRHFAQNPAFFVQLVDRAIREGWQGLNEHAPLAGRTGSAHDKVEQTIRTNLSLGEQLRLRGE